MFSVRSHYFHRFFIRGSIVFVITFSTEKIYANKTEIQNSEHDVRQASCCVFCLRALPVPIVWTRARFSLSIGTKCGTLASLFRSAFQLFANSATAKARRQFRSLRTLPGLALDVQLWLFAKWMMTKVRQTFLHVFRK